MRAFLFALSCLASAAQAGLIANPGFEDPVIAPGSFLNGTPPSWSGPTAQTFLCGITAQLSALPPIPEGNQVAFVNNFASPDGPTSNALAQQIAADLETNIAYVFSASFGWRNDNAESRGRLELWCGGSVSQGNVVGGTLLASKIVTLQKGQFVRETLVYNSLPPWDHIGERLSVRLVGTPVANNFAQTNFDDAQLLAIELLPCQADITRDNLVDDADFLVFAAQYNNLLCSPEPDEWVLPHHCSADLNRDSVVDDSDFSLFVNAYDELLCPEFTPTITPVDQKRSINAAVPPYSSYNAAASDYNAFNMTLSASGGGQFARAAQNSVLGSHGFSVYHIAEGPGLGPAADSHFYFVFDLDVSTSRFVLTNSITRSLVYGAFEGPGLNLNLAGSLERHDFLPAGRYKVTSHCSGGFGQSGEATIGFSLAP